MNRHGDREPFSRSSQRRQLMRYERSFNILYPCRVYMRPTETSLVLISVEIDEREFNLIREIIIIISVNVDKLAQEFVIKKKKKLVEFIYGRSARRRFINLLKLNDSNLNERRKFRSILSA